MDSFEKVKTYVFSNEVQLRSVFFLNGYPLSFDIDDNYRALKLINMILKQWSHVKLVKKRNRSRIKRDYVCEYRLELLPIDDLCVPYEPILYDILDLGNDLDLLVDLLSNRHLSKKITVQLKPRRKLKLKV